MKKVFSRVRLINIFTQNRAKNASKQETLADQVKGARTAKHKASSGSKNGPTLLGIIWSILGLFLLINFILAEGQNNSGQVADIPSLGDQISITSPPAMPAGLNFDRVFLLTDVLSNAGPECSIDLIQASQSHATLFVTAVRKDGVAVLFSDPGLSAAPGVCPNGSTVLVSMQDYLNLIYASRIGVK